MLPVVLLVTVLSTAFIKLPPCSFVLMHHLSSSPHEARLVWLIILYFFHFWIFTPTVSTFSPTSCWSYSPYHTLCRSTILSLTASLSCGGDGWMGEIELRSGVSVIDWLIAICSTWAQSQSVEATILVSCRGSNIYFKQWHANDFITFVCLFFSCYSVSITMKLP